MQAKQLSNDRLFDMDKKLREIKQRCTLEPYLLQLDPVNRACRLEKMMVEMVEILRDLIAERLGE